MVEKIHDKPEIEPAGWTVAYPGRKPHLITLVKRERDFYQANDFTVTPVYTAASFIEATEKFLKAQNAQP